MASVHRRQRSPFWWAGFRQAGKWVFRSTKSKDRAIAERIADEWEQAGKKAVAGDLIEAQARKVLASIMERANVGETLRAPSTRAFLTGWLEHKESSKSSATSARYAGTVRGFLQSLGPRADRPVTSVRSGDVQAYLTGRGRNRATKTVVVDGKTLSAAFAYGVRTGVLDRNPALQVELPKIVSNERDVFTPEQVGILAREASADWRTAIFAGYFLGARLSDIVNLKWADVDLVAGVVSYRQRKTSEATTTALHPDLQRHLEAIAGDSGEFIMPSLAGRSTGGCRGLSSDFNGIMRRAGIAQDRTESKSGRSFAALSFHSLRHTFESALANAGVSAEVRREITGRADDVVQRGYTHLAIETQRAALAKMPGVGA
ncbi:MAG: hypothetical protein EBR82_39060 [Caulobacteraceae bacterium]|nr:hypothetical protein [Caulobacteraceae bacterium]